MAPGKGLPALAALRKERTASGHGFTRATVWSGGDLVSHRDLFSILMIYDRSSAIQTYEKRPCFPIFQSYFQVFMFTVLVYVTLPYLFFPDVSFVLSVFLVGYLFLLVLRGLYCVPCFICFSSYTARTICFSRRLSVFPCNVAFL